MRSTLSSGAVLDELRDERLVRLEAEPHYTIYDAGVKQAAAMTLLVQSSGLPISLGAEMRPYMDTVRLWEYVRANDVPLKPDSPAEVYVYNWVDRAQGPMVFDVGVVVEDGYRGVDPESRFVVKRYSAMKVASLVYEGPFPHQPNSGWHRIRWEDRARDKGLVYTERVYRELYHRYDYQTHRHVTEIQIEVE